MDNVSELTTEQLFTVHGFRRKEHSADRVGTYSRQWKGQVLLTTDSDVPDEIQLERDIEALVLSGALPMFGYNWRLAAISFTWGFTSDELQLMGAATRCAIRVTYLADVDALHAAELNHRLEALGVHPAPGSEES